MRGYWSAQFVARWAPYMTVGSAMRVRRAFSLDVDCAQTVSVVLRPPIGRRVQIRVPSSDLGAIGEVMRQKVYSPIKKHVKKARAVLDLGANIGIATNYFASIYPNAQIIAVEPHPETFELLVENTRHANFRGLVTPVHAAVWHEAGSLKLTTPESGAYVAATVVERSYDGDCVAEGIEVPAVRVQDLLAKLDGGQADIVKMDVEGAEAVLLSSSNDWIDSVRCLAVEFHADSREASGFDALMKEKGLRVYEYPHTVLGVRE
ncbi:Methyltransferase domain protein [Planctomycetes bacterium K2D]|nr:Methyltransferase domain protein [Planctomycetes bacterium K2D]